MSFSKSIWLNLRGTPPWGFRLRGGKGTGSPLVISRVNSKGRQQGLKEGDCVLSVNGKSALDMTHADAQRALKDSNDSLELQLERNIVIPETNRNGANQNGRTEEDNNVTSHLNALDEYMNQLDVNSWSTDSTSTGSTTIHVSSLNSDELSSSDGVWSPTTKRANLRLNCNLRTSNKSPEPLQSNEDKNNTPTKQEKEEESSPVWQPFGAPCEVQFRPVKLEIKSPKMTTTAQQNDIPKKKEPEKSESKLESPKPAENLKKSDSSTSNGPTEDYKPPDISSAPTTFTKSGWSSHLPPSQSPTITLLQKAREGQIPKGAIYIEDKPDTTPIPKNAVLIDQKVIVEGDKVHTDSYYAVPTVTTETTTHSVKGQPPKYDGIGPTEYGIPVGLRTGVKEEYASDWYKSMYKSLHRVKFPNEGGHTQMVHLGGYMSEPEFDRNEKLKAKYATSDYRRKPEKSMPVTNMRQTSPEKLSPLPVDTTIIRHEPRREVYKVEPRSIAEYEPGKSSLAEKEFQKHEYLGSSPKTQQGLSRRWPNVLLSDGYESDSTLIRKTGRNIEVDPEQQKSWYKEIQKGGEIPLTGLRKTVPEKPTEIRNQDLRHALLKSQPFNRADYKTTSHSTLQIKITNSIAKPFPQIRSIYAPTTMSVKNTAPVPPIRASSKKFSFLNSEAARLKQIDSRNSTSALKQMPHHISTDSTLNDFSFFSQTKSDPQGLKPEYCSSVSHDTVGGTLKSFMEHETSNGHQNDNALQTESFDYKSEIKQLNQHQQRHIDNFNNNHINSDNNNLSRTRLSLKQEEISKNPKIISNCSIDEKDNLCSTSISVLPDTSIDVSELKCADENQNLKVNKNRFRENFDSVTVQRNLSQSLPIDHHYSDPCKKATISKINKSFSTRMITILPPISFSSITSTRGLKSHVVHSVSQNNKKLQCGHLSNVNPLKTFLKMNENFLFKANDCAPDYLSTVKLLLKNHHKPMSHSFKRDQKLISNPTLSKNEADNKLHLDVSYNKMKQRLTPFKQFVNSCKSSTDNMLSTNPSSTKSNCVSNNSIKSLNNFRNNKLSRNNNLMLNEKNALVYQEYATAMVQSTPKSRSFTRLKNYYATLGEAPNSCNGLHHMQVKTVSISSRSISCPHWHKDLDINLKCKHSSVGNLKQLYQQTFGRNHQSLQTFRMSFQYKRMLYSASVSNLVKKYNSMLYLQKLEMITHHSCKQAQYSRYLTADFKNSPKRFKDRESKGAFLSNEWHALSRDKDSPTKYCDSEADSSELNSAKYRSSPSLNSSIDDAEIPNHVQRRVKYFEKISEKPHLRSNKSNLSRNLSYCDLRNTEEDETRSFSRLFSPHYVPERAMSCLDLSPESVDVSSSENSFQSYRDTSKSFCTTECHDIHTTRIIRTGTVAQIKRKLEKSLTLRNGTTHSLGGSSLTRWCSVPDGISSNTMVNQVEKRRSYPFKKSPAFAKYSSGSVQNLIKRFEPEPLLPAVNTFQQEIKLEYSASDLGDRTFHLDDLNNNLNVKQEFDPFTFHSNIFSDLSLPLNIRSPKDYLNTSLKLEFTDSPENRFMTNVKYEDRHEWESCSNSSTENSMNRAPISNVDDLYLRPFVTTSFNSVSWNHDEKLPMFEDICPRRSEIMNMYKPISNFMQKLKINPYLRVTNSSPRPYVKKFIEDKDWSLQPASPHQYQETEVNIHYRAPIRHLEKDYIEEEELKKIQEDAMRKLYEEERRKKQQQELAEIEMRRHSDFFTPSQKSPIPLNRYDNPFDSAYYRLSPSGYHRGPPPKTMARAIYPFTAQTTRELSLNKGDIVYINKLLDRNWYEGEHHGLIGIFPVSYVEIIPNEKANLQPRKAMEGEAIVKYNFRAQTPMELSLFKGEKVILLRKADRNWYEGRLGTKKGIFPVSYVQVLQEPGESPGPRAISPKPPASPVFPIINGSPPKSNEGPTFNTGLRPNQEKPTLKLDKLDGKSSLTQTLHIDTYNEPIPYRSLYTYKPQNDDELELKEGDTVYVMEKCDDGWYVGTSLRTGQFGTFPGNYVERI